MPFRTVALAALVLLIPAFAVAQTPPVTRLKGKFRDVTTNAAVSGVQVKLTSFADTSDVHRVTAGDGRVGQRRRVIARAGRQLLLAQVAGVGVQ